MSRAGERRRVRDSVARHYDSLALLYRLFWGEHIHHGLWQDGDDGLRGAPQRLVEHLAARADIRGGESVLDVGCGYGASGRWLAGGLGCRVVGLTISAGQARYASRRNARRGLSARTRVVRGDAEALPFRADGFDVVWVIECSEHLEDKAGFVAAAAERLRSGGRLALCSWLAGRELEGRRRWLEEVCQRFLCPSLATADDYRRWCETAGLRVLHEENLTGGVARTWDVLIHRIERPWLSWLKPFILDPAQRRFVDGFPVIREAYATGAMEYGLFVAAKP